MAIRYLGEGMLIDWQDDRGGWTLTDALAGTIVFGATGGGKTSGPGALLRTSFLTPTKTLPGGMGGLVLLAKNGEAPEWIMAIEKAGRGKDVILITLESGHGYNFINGHALWGKGSERGSLAIIDTLLQVARATNPVNAAASSGDGAFFDGAHEQKLRNLVTLIQLARLPVSLPLMRAISSSAPATTAQTYDSTWQQSSICWQVLREADALTLNDPAARADYGECATYFLKDYVSLSDRTKSVVEILFSGLLGPFLTRPLRPLFCEHTNIVPEMCFDGKIILLDIPVHEFHLVGKIAALVWKRAFQLAVMRRSGAPDSLRPVFLWADECQNFISERDNEYQAVARGSGGVTCFLSQNFAGIREALGSDDKAENLIANLQTKFFCQNTGETNEWAATLIGDRYITVTDINMGRGSGSQASLTGDATSHAGISRHEVKRAYLEPSVFQRLRRGGPHANFLVDSVVFCGGKLFAGEKGELRPYKILSFRQR